MKSNMSKNRTQFIRVGNQIEGLLFIPGNQTREIYIF